MLFRSKKQKEAKDAILKAQFDLNKGNITQAQYEQTLLDNQKKLAEGNSEIKEARKAQNDLRKAGVNLEILTLDEQKKQTKEVIAQYELAKQRFESENSVSAQLNKESNLRSQLAILQKGLLEDERIQQDLKLEILAKNTSEATRQVEQYKAVYASAAKQYQLELSRGKVTEKTAKNYEEATAKAKDLQNVLTEAQIAELTANVKISIDKAKAESEAETLRSQLSLKEIEFKVKIGELTNTDLLNKRLELLQKEVSTVAGDLEIEIGLGEIGRAHV